MDRWDKQEGRKIMNNWISVRDELPDSNSLVLIYNKINNDQKFAYYTIGFFDKYWQDEEY